jgi:hypothetical protein
MAGESRTLNKDSWLLDSGASVHITHNKLIFSSYTPLDNHKIVGIGLKPAKGEGTVKLAFHMGSQSTTMLLQRILYLPSFPYNLLCLGKLHCTVHRLHFGINFLDIEIYTRGGNKLAHCCNVGDVYALGNVKPILPVRVETSKVR